MRKRLDKFLWRSYRWFSTFYYWRQRRFTPLGKLILGLMLICALIGIDMSLALSYQLFVVSLILILIAILNRRRLHIKFTVERHLPKYATVDRPLTYQLTLGNLTRDSFERLFVLDVLRDPRPDFNYFYRVQEPQQVTNNIFDRFFRYPRWRWMVQQNTLADIPLGVLPRLAAGQQVNVTITLTPKRRGVLQFTRTELFQPDSLGIFNSSKAIECTQSMVILPKQYHLPSLSFPGRRQHNLGGFCQANSVADAEEFVSMREYRPGDSIRRIHWKSWAKTNQPIVKQYQEEYFSRYGLILDTFGDETRNDQFEEAVSLASSFIYSLSSEDSFIDLMFVTNKAYHYTTGRGVGQQASLLEVLASVKQSDAADFNQLSMTINSNLGILSGAILIFIDWEQKRQQLLQRLRYQQIPYRVFVIVSPQVPLTDSMVIDENVTILEAGNIQAGLAQA